MRVIRGLDSVGFSGVVLTLGNFDGVHRGHQAILEAGRRRADAAGTELVIMTFDPHPLAVLTPDHVPPILTPLDEKLRLLEMHGADATLLVHSSPEFLKLTAGEFIDTVIVKRFAPVAMVEGASFGFGRHRQGDVNTLRAAGREKGFAVEIVEPVRVALGPNPDAVISSSLVRQLISSNAVDKVMLCLGRAYALVGRVIRGAGRGRQIGCPTANLHAPGQLTPGEGVYAGRAVVDTETFPAAISIGRNPTFDGEDVVVEAHLLDFDRDIYDQMIRLEFLAWLRGQVKYDSIEALCRQMDDDIEQTREICKNASL